MYDLEQIGKIFADLEKYFRDLDQLKVENQLLGTERFYSLSMLLFAILNRTIDLGKEIIRGRKLGLPASYREIFQILEKEKIISSELSQKLQYLANRRNLLAHEYFDITEKSIFLMYLKVSSIKEFMKVASELVKREKNGRKKNNNHRLLPKRE